MATVVTEFDAVSIANASLQFKNGATYEQGTPFGCIGSIEGETESLVKALKCGADILKEITKPNKLTLKVVVANVPVQVARDVFGLSNTGLKPGVYAYGTNSRGKKFILTADVIDEFEDVTKMIAFPNCSTATGFKIQTIENGAEEVANIEFEITVLKDAAGELYYEALVPEVDDANIKTQWHTAFTRALVELATP